MLVFNKDSRKNIFLAPMAGVTDRAFRMIVDSFGTSSVCSEMVSAKALVYGDKKTVNIMSRDDYSCFYGVQIFGHEPDYMSEAVKLINNVDFIDINMGCPANKIIKNHDGGSLLRDIKLIEKIVRTVVYSSSVPVTVKIRAGFDEDSVNAVEVSKAVESSGAYAICIHPRTVVQQYSGSADYDLIAQVVESVNIPVIGCGDITSPEDAEKMIQRCGVSAVMIGRACLGRPWFLKEVLNYFKGIDSNEFYVDKFSTAENHLRLLVQYKGEPVGVMEARKHIAWYFKGEKGANVLKQKAHKAHTLDQMIDVINEARYRSSVAI